MNKYKNTIWGLLTLILCSCQFARKDVTLNQFSTKRLNVEFNGISAIQVVNSLVNKSIKSSSKIQRYNILFDTKEQEDTPIWLASNSITLMGLLKHIAELSCSQLVIVNNNLLFKIKPLPIPPPDVSNEKRIVKKAKLNKKERFSIKQIQAAQQILRYATETGIGAVGYGAEIPVESYAISILLNSSNPDYYLKEYYEESTVEGKAYLLTGLHHIKSLYMNQAKKIFFDESTEINSISGCISSSETTEVFYKEWIKTGELYDSINLDFNTAFRNK